MQLQAQLTSLSDVVRTSVRTTQAALLVVFVAAVNKVPRGVEAATATASASVLVSGQVPCSQGTSIDVTAVPAFPNATVQLVCDGNLLTSVRTDVNGSFVANLGNVLTQPNLLTALLTKRCNAVVTTPLVNCNASLASAAGTLIAPLQILGTATGSSAGLVTTLIGGQIIGIVGGLINVVTGLFSGA